MRNNSRINPSDVGLGLVAVVIVFSIWGAICNGDFGSNLTWVVVIAVLAGGLGFIIASNLSGHAQAEILNKKSTRWDQGDYDYIVTVQFNTNQGARIMTAHVDYDFFNHVEEGMTTDVEYHQTFPRLFRLKGER